MKEKEKESRESHASPASDTTGQTHKMGPTSHLDEASILPLRNEYPPSITPTEASTLAVVGEHVEVTRRPARIVSARQSTSEDSYDQSPNYIIAQLEDFRFTPVAGTLNIMELSNRHAQIQMAGTKLLTVCNDLERLSILLSQLHQPHPLLNSNAMTKLRGEVDEAVIHYHRWMKRIDAFRKWGRSKALMGEEWWDTIDKRLEALKDLDVEHIKVRIESLMAQRDSAPPKNQRRLSGGSQISQSRSRAPNRSSCSRSTTTPLISNRASRPKTCKNVASTRGSHPSSRNSITTSIIEGVQFVAKARGKTYFRRTPVPREWTGESKHAGAEPRLKAATSMRNAFSNTTKASVYNILCSARQRSPFFSVSRRPDSPRPPESGQSSVDDMYGEPFHLQKIVFGSTVPKSYSTSRGRRVGLAHGIRTLPSMLYRSCPGRFCPPFRRDKEHTIVRGGGYENYTGDTIPTPEDRTKVVLRGSGRRAD